MYCKKKVKTKKEKRGNKGKLIRLISLLLVIGLGIIATIEWTQILFIMFNDTKENTIEDDDIEGTKRECGSQYTRKRKSSRRKRKREREKMKKNRAS